jgi:Ser/Thr protein kinase RdoA (MazF antagonist)
LTRKGISVSTPILDTDGQIVRVVPAPEGETLCRALFTHASGKELSFEGTHAIRNIWLMGLHAGEVHWGGLALMKGSYFDRHLTFLRNCERDYF